MGSPAIGLIREDKVAQMYSVLQTGKCGSNVDQALQKLVTTGEITPRVAKKSKAKENFVLSFELYVVSPSAL